MRPEALLFDLDGTLLDSELLWEKAQQSTMRYFGQEWTADDQAHSIGGPLERVVNHIAGRTAADPGHIARVLVTEIEHEVASRTANWMPGARELMLQAAAADIPIAIVSNSWRVLLDLLIRNMDVPVTATISSTEVGNPKPHPEPYLAACELLGSQPARTVVIEDSPTGAAAGITAGCFVLAVGPAVAHLQGDSVRHVDSLADVDLDSIRGDRVQDA